MIKFIQQLNVNEIVNCCKIEFNQNSTIADPKSDTKSD